MFEKTYKATVESGEFENFVRLLGKHGMRFDFTNLKIVSDPVDPWRVNASREFKITATPWKWKRLKKDIELISMYRMG